MRRTFMGADSGAWCADPRVALQNYYAPQGIGADIIATIDGFTREDVDRYAAESQRRAAKSWDEGNFSKSVIRVTDVLGNVLLDNDEYRRPQTTLETLSTMKPALHGMAALGFTAVAMPKYPPMEAHNTVNTGCNSSDIFQGQRTVRC